MEFVTSYIVVDKKTCKNCTLSFRMFALIISAFRNNVGKLHLHLLHRSGEINNNALKLRLLVYLQAIHCRRAATLGTVTKWRSKNYSEFLLSESFLIYSSFPMISCFWHHGV
jgi:hypothetical protein